MLSSLEISQPMILQEEKVTTKEKGLAKKRFFGPTLFIIGDIRDVVIKHSSTCHCYVAWKSLRGAFHAKKPPQTRHHSANFSACKVVVAFIHTHCKYFGSETLQAEKFAV